MNIYQVTTISGKYEIQAETSGVAEASIRQQTRERVYSVTEIQE